MSQTCLSPGAARRPGPRRASRRPRAIPAAAAPRRWRVIPAATASRCTAWTALACVLLFLAAACAGPGRSAPVPAVVGARPERIDARLAADPAVEGLIVPYRGQVEARMGEPLAIAPVALERGSPESPLGNLVADIVLARARAESGIPVDACLLNEGGLRISWPAGRITLGLVYELMPFDNTITLLRLSADQMRALADEIAAQGGEPLSGMSVAIERAGTGAAGGGDRGDSAAARRRAADLRIGGEPLSARDYWLATNSYLADGGGGMETLWSPLEKRALPVLIRDAIADACRAYGARGERGALGTLPVPEGGRIVARGEGGR